MIKDRYSLEDFYFELPHTLIAQIPTEKRDSSRLMVLNRERGSYEHRAFSELADFLRGGDLLVFNDTKVIHARVRCRRSTGGNVELLLLRRIDDYRWEAICEKMGRLRQGEALVPIKNGSISIRIIKRSGDQLQIESNIVLSESVLHAIGDIALPPYIKRNASEADEQRYQTVFAKEPGAIAAPTAGLHFTDELMSKIKQRGALTAFVTLHVSWGTFQPVRETDIAGHVMHSERYILSKETAAEINRTREQGGRIIAVGTTSLRVIESTFMHGSNNPGSGETDLFIYPPMRVRSINALITNFHTPYSTLLMLVSAFAGYETIMAAYKEAVRLQYRFFSYGDAMLIE